MYRRFLPLAAIEAALLAGLLAALWHAPRASAAALEGSDATVERGRTDEDGDRHRTASSFPFRFFDAIARSDAIEGPNIFVSPVSAAVALGMLQSGASGETQSAIARALDAQGISFEQIDRANAALLRRLDGRTDVELLIANSLWTRRDVAFEEAYLRRTRSGYRATVRSTDLASVAAMHEINDWVSSNTKGRIPEMLDGPLSPDDVLLLLNAVYFRGTWLHPFDSSRTHDGVFHAAAGTRRVPFMHRESTIRVGSGEGFRIARLPYRGDETAMWIVLPDPDVAPAALRERLNAERWREWTGAATSTRVLLSLPRFEVDFATDLNAPLHALGMGIAFDPSRADLTRMLSRARLGQNAYVSSARQRAVVEVNEQGTVAAAVTSITVTAASAQRPPPHLLVDRPFLIVIEDDRSGAILFMGEIGDPSVK